MQMVLSIAVGGALGALGRYGLVSFSDTLFNRGFPVGTLIVNIIGSLLGGLLLTVFVQRPELNPALRAGLMVGFLGGFTTFSAFSLETITLLQQGAMLRGVINVLLSVGFCLLAACLGLSLGRSLNG